MARIAVIVPVYNGGAYLRQCIESILGQTYTDFTCWLVDDGSTDGSGAVCDEAAKNDPRIRVIHKNNEGLVATWMRGVRESQEPYLCFADCDDWVGPDYLAHMVKALPAESEDSSGEGRIICGGYVIEREWNHTQEKKESAAAPGVYMGERLSNEIKRQVLGREKRILILSRCMKLISRKLFEDNMKFCDPAVRMGEDVSIMVPAILDADSVVVLSGACDYHYRFVNASMVHQYDAGMYNNMVLLRKLLYREMKEKNIPEGKEMVDREFLFLFLLVMKNEIRRRNVPVSEVASRIRDLCRRENSAEMLHVYPEKLQDPANRLLSFVMEKPTNLRIRLVKKIFDWKDASG